MKFFRIDFVWSAEYGGHKHNSRTFIGAPDEEKAIKMLHRQYWDCENIIIKECEEIHPTGVYVMQAIFTPI